eukprot:1279254-Heterocapsa_arctica.AAC.1
MTNCRGSSPSARCRAYAAVSLFLSAVMLNVLHSRSGPSRAARPPSSGRSRTPWRSQTAPH